MRHADIEDWTLSTADRVRKLDTVEDSRVELKAVWPTDIARAARQIAGLANAAGGSPVLWIIGQDEKTGAVQDTSGEDVQVWWSGIVSQFDEGIAPAMQHIAVPYGGVHLTAILFETDRAPYVVKNPGGGNPQREVPWREGTDLRTARRSDLIRLLVPASRLPEAELTFASALLSHESGSGEISLVAIRGPAARVIFVRVVDHGGRWLRGRSAGLPSCSTMGLRVGP